MTDLVQELRKEAELDGLDPAVCLNARAADEIERLQFLARLLADEDANGVAYLFSEHPHLMELFDDTKEGTTDTQT